MHSIIISSFDIQLFFMMRFSFSGHFFLKNDKSLPTISPFRGATDTLVFGLLVTSALGFKAKGRFLACQQSYVKDLFLGISSFALGNFEMRKNTINVHLPYFIMKSITQQLQVRNNQIPLHNMTDIAQTNLNISAAEDAELWDCGLNWIKLNPFEMFGLLNLRFRIIRIQEGAGIHAPPPLHQNFIIFQAFLVRNWSTAVDCCVSKSEFWTLEYFNFKSF